MFVDIEPDTCNIDAALIEAAITPRTRAIMPVSLYGQVADMDAINAIAARHGLPVIEDAAQSFGATYQGRQQLQPEHLRLHQLLPEQAAGLLRRRRRDLHRRRRAGAGRREIRVHGQSARYTHTRVGVGGRMDTLQCAVRAGQAGALRVGAAAPRTSSARATRA